MIVPHVFDLQTKMNIELGQEQNDIIRELRAIDPEQIFKGIPDVVSQSHIPEDPVGKQHPITMFFDVDYDQEHEQLKDKLMSYRKKSEQIYQVGQLLQQYEAKFSSLMEDKDKLIALLTEMKGETSQLVDKQKKMIDLSMKLKESLDYYSYHQKFNFDYPCEISCREMYENILQQTLSELTDGIMYFQENSTYANSKKYLSMFKDSRSKIYSFVKSFFIKLFNKESEFMNGNVKVNFNGLVQNLYPKSKIKFVNTFIILFPQFTHKIGQILKSVKESSSEEEIKLLQMKEIQIYSFELNSSNHGLIKYLQQFVPEIYQESILNFFVYYRSAFHQNHIKQNQVKKQGNLPELFQQRYNQSLYLLTCEYAYLCFCCRISDYDKSELVRTTVTNLARLHFQELNKMVKENKNKSPFQLCQSIMKIKHDYPVFLDRHMTEEYESYVFGCVGGGINDPEHLAFLKSLFDGYAQKFLNDLELLCFNILPKFEVKKQKAEIEKQIRLFLDSIPKLKYCEQYAQKFLIAALDSIVKSIKEVNAKIESRFECYLWNIQIFSTIRGSLRGVRGQLVRKELKLDVNNSSNIIQRMKGIDRNESLLKYAQDLFNVLKTGMPVINELTLDFSKYINEHCQALQNQFVKDILYIYAKNMIQFLQKLSEATKTGEQTVKQVCQALNIQSLYSSYLLSLQKYVKDSSILLKERESYKFSNEASELIMNLLNIVYDKLFDFLDKFYVQVSQHVDYTEKFKEIETLKSTFRKQW